jgi:hypothetical protein
MEQALRELFLVFVQRVQPAIEPVIIDLLPRDPQQILRRRALIPALGPRPDRSVARRTGRWPADRRSDPRELPCALEGSVRSRACAVPDDARARAPDTLRQTRYYARRAPRTRLPRATTAGRAERFCFPTRVVWPECGLRANHQGYSNSRGLAHPAQATCPAWRRCAGGAARLDQRPIFIGGVIGRATMAAQIHECILHSSGQGRQRAVLHYKATAGSAQPNHWIYGKICQLISQKLFRPTSCFGRRANALLEKLNTAPP